MKVALDLESWQEVAWYLGDVKLMQIQAKYISTGHFIQTLCGPMEVTTVGRLHEGSSPEDAAAASNG